MDIRCPAKKFGELLRSSDDEGILEVSCPSRFCGRQSYVLVIHQFSTQTGKLLNTNYYKNPDRSVK